MSAEQAPAQYLLQSMSTGWEARLDILKRDAEHDVLGPLRTHGWQASIDREVERGECFPSTSTHRFFDPFFQPSNRSRGAGDLLEAPRSTDPWEVQWPGIETWTSTASQMICRRRN